MSVEEFKQIKGVGDAVAKKIIDAGYKSLEELSVANPEAVKASLKVSSNKAKALVEAAKSLTTVDFDFMTGEEVLNFHTNVLQKISTNSVDLDRILGGGISTGAITAFYGQLASGKTQICHQVAVNTRKHTGRRTAWIETEPLTVQPERLLEMAKAQGVNFDLKKDISIVSGQFIRTPVQQFKAYQFVKKKLATGEDIGLLVVDSFNARFRTSYGGREMLPGRSSEQARHIGYLQDLALDYNLAVIITLQVMGVPDSGAQLGTIKKFGIRTPPVGAHSLKHGVQYWVALDQVSSNDLTWKAILVDGSMPRDESTFIIDTSGVRDTAGKSGRV